MMPAAVAAMTPVAAMMSTMLSAVASVLIVAAMAGTVSLSGLTEEPPVPSVALGGASPAMPVALEATDQAFQKTHLLCSFALVLHAYNYLPMIIRSFLMTAFNHG